MKKAFQTHIILRTMDDDTMNSFLETYNNARYTTGREKRICTNRDREIYKRFKEGWLMQELAEEYQRSYSWIHRSIKLAIAELDEKKYE